MSSFLFAGGVACAYLASVIGLHRLNVRRQRKQSGGFQTLGWLDWDTLFDGLDGLDRLGPPAADARAFGGGPLPALPGQAGAEDRRALLLALSLGNEVGEGPLSHAFSGGQLEWLTTLIDVARRPERALERLEAAELSTPAELYLRERLRLQHRTHALNLELSVFSAKRRLTQGLNRFGEHPALFFARAYASALIGFNQTAIDDMARAVYFSRQASFYARAVAETPYIDEARPALAQQCRLALEVVRKVG